MLGRPQIGWQSKHTATHARRLVVREFCATCWGQGRILEPGPLGLMPVVCPSCGMKEDR